MLWGFKLGNYLKYWREQNKEKIMLIPMLSLTHGYGRCEDCREVFIYFWSITDPEAIPMTCAYCGKKAVKPIPDSTVTPDDLMVVGKRLTQLGFTGKKNIAPLDDLF